jgi:protein-S-isoprenylcysteine O-methyltransferase Ste14
MPSWHKPELVIPPDVVALVVGGLMWLAARAMPALEAPISARVLVALPFFVGGAYLIASARIAFAREGTTFSPFAPSRTTRLVTTGVYRYSRNPMYLGTLLVLLSLGAVLGSPASALVAMTYALYIDRFQIAPEEQVLRARFGEVYDDYVRRVRRWA